MNHFSTTLLKVLCVTVIISALTACKITSDQTGDVYGHQQRDLREECLRALKWQRQQNIDGLYDDNASEGDRLVSAIVLSNTSEADERLKCESLGQRGYIVEGVPQKPPSKKQNITGER
jgi:hypothetical protein